MAILPQRARPVCRAAGRRGRPALRRRARRPARRGGRVADEPARTRGGPAMTGTGTGPRSQPDAPLDWATIRARLERTERASLGAPEPTPERARAVLEAPPRAPARGPTPPPDAPPVLTIPHLAP